MVKKFVLGTQYQSGNSEVCVDLPKAQNLQPGLAVKIGEDGIPAAGGVYGVSGAEIYRVNTPVITSGLKVCMQLDGEAPAIGSAATINDTTGKISSSGTATNGTIASEKVKGIYVKKDGTLEEMDAVLVDMANGL